MSTHARLIESVRRTRRALYLVAGLYIIVGFVVATATAVQGDLIGTFLGFLIISGALSVAMIARTALQVLVRIARIEQHLGGFTARVDSLIPLGQPEPASQKLGHTAVEVGNEPVVWDLSEIGVGDPRVLAAATLDRDVYPRLLQTMAADDQSASHAAASKADSKRPNGNSSRRASNVSHGPPLTLDLQRDWHAALASQDLLECRRIFSAMLELSDPEVVEPMQAQIQDLENRVEERLRAQFAQKVKDRDFSGALVVGKDICRLLGHRPVAADFERLRPILTRRADEALALAATNYASAPLN